MMAGDEYYIFTGREVVPLDVTRVRIDKSVTVIPAQAFEGRPITELYCHIGVVRVEEDAFRNCRSLRLVIMRGVKVVEQNAFVFCNALTDVECGKLEIIGYNAFEFCESLRSIDLLSIKIVDRDAFWWCKALTNVKFGKELESIRAGAFTHCTSLERITIPLKDGMITHDNIFLWCRNLKDINLVEGELHETIAALLLEEWRNDMCREIDAIYQILPNGNVGCKAEAIRVWIKNVLRKIIHYKAQHHRYLKEAATTLELALWKKRLSEINISEGDEEGRRAKCRVKCGADIVMKNVLPFLELPPYTFGEED